MPRYFLHLAYNGNNYHGWQVQDNAPTIQQKIEQALTVLLYQPISILGCGRTDTGVHARDFYAHFDVLEVLSLPDELVRRLNRYLPPDIVIFYCYPVREEAHARFDALSRTYSYYIHTYKQPFVGDFSHFIYGDLNVSLMNQASQVLFDYSDFTSFSKLHTQVKTNRCKVMKAEWIQEGHQLIFTIQADRFLRNMVRAIVGTLVEVGKEKRTVDGVRQVIESKDRCNAGVSVPAKALFLTKVIYPESIFL